MINRLAGDFLRLQNRSGRRIFEYNCRTTDSITAPNSRLSRIGGDPISSTQRPVNPARAATRPWYKSRWALGTALVLVLLLAAAEIVVRVTIDAEFITSRVNRRLQAAGNQGQVTIDHVSASFLLLRMKADRLVFAGADGDRQPVGLVVDSVHVRAINPIRSWWRHGLAASTVTLWGPSLAVRDLPVRRYRAETPGTRATFASTTEPDTGATGVINRSLARALPFVACREIGIVDGTITIGHARGSDTTSFSATGIEATFSDVLVDTTAEESRTRLFFSESFSFSAVGPERPVGDSLYELRIGGIHGSSSSNTITLDSASLTLSVSEDEFAARKEHRAYSFRTAVRGLTIHRPDFARLLRQEIVAGQIEVDSVFFYLFSDKRLPPDAAAPPPLLPHEAFQRIPWYVAIDSLTVRTGEVIYAERATDGSWPGTVRFTDTRASITNITNDPARMTSTTPAVAYLSGRIEGSAGISVTMHLPLLGSQFNCSYRGLVKQLDPRLLNGMFVNLEGIQVNSGMVDSILFDVTVEQGRARGELIAVYRDLHIGVVSKVDSGQGLFKKLKTALFNFGVLKEHNRPERRKTYEIGRIDYTRKEDDPFFKFLWVSLRGGLFDVTGLK